MPNAANAKLQYEAGQAHVAMAAMTDSGDHKMFTLTDATLWSSKAGYAPQILPNGLVTGGVVAPLAANNDKVTTTALTCYLAGVLTSVAANNSVSITRAATAVSKVNSITVTSAGVIAAVAGTDGSTTAFSETRAAAGGPPLIPVGSIEIAQVRTTSNSAAPITAAEIFSVVGTHVERWDYPLVNPYPLGDATNAAAYALFDTALPLIHTGPIAKAVYAEVYTPVFADVPLASDFAPPEETYTVNSTQVYGGTVASSAKALGQGKFTVLPKDGVTDAMVAQAGQLLTWKFFPDRTKLPYLLVQGTLGISRTFPAGANIQAACTLSAALKGVERAS